MYIDNNKGLVSQAITSLGQTKTLRKQMWG